MDNLWISPAARRSNKVVQTVQAAPVIVFYLGNSVALTLCILFLEICSSVALTVIYSIPSNGEIVNRFFAKR